MDWSGIGLSHYNGERAGQSTETNCESFPGYIEAGCVREIG